MTLSQFWGRQLAKPSGFIGKNILAPLWNKRNKSLNDTALEALKIEERDRILEVGFGGGYLMNEMIKKTIHGKIVGIDISKELVKAGVRKFEQYIKNGKMELKCAKAETLPFPAKFFTKVCSINSIFYWEDALDAFIEMNRVLEQNGMVVICFTSKQHLKNLKLVHEALKQYEKQDVMDMLEKAGFRQLECHTAADSHREYYCITGIKTESPELRELE
jgi:arsenite methyltransferase